MKIHEISSKVLSKVKSQLSYPPLNLKKRYWKIIKRHGRNFHNGLYRSLPEFAVMIETKFTYRRAKKMFVKTEIPPEHMLNFVIRSKVGQRSKVKVIYFQTPVLETDVLWHGTVCRSVCPSICL